MSMGHGPLCDCCKDDQMTMIGIGVLILAVITLLAKIK